MSWSWRGLIFREDEGSYSDSSSELPASRKMATCAAGCALVCFLTVSIVGGRGGGRQRPVSIVLQMKNECTLWGCETVGAGVNESQLQQALERSEDDRTLLEASQRKIGDLDAALRTSQKQQSLLEAALAKNRERENRMASLERRGLGWRGVLAQLGVRHWDFEEREKDAKWEKQLKAAEYWAMQRDNPFEESFVEAEVRLLAKDLVSADPCFRRCLWLCILQRICFLQRRDLRLRRANT